MKVKELLSDESKWTQNAYARNEHENVVGYNDTMAVRWCLIGAINVCYPTLEEYAQVKQKLNDELRKRSGSSDAVYFNDGRTFEEVKGLVELLDI